MYFASDCLYIRHPGTNISKLSSIYTDDIMTKRLKVMKVFPVKSCPRRIDIFHPTTQGLPHWFWSTSFSGEYYQFFCSFCPRSDHSENWNPYSLHTTPPKVLFYTNLSSNSLRWKFFLFQNSQLHFKFHANLPIGFRTWVFQRKSNMQLPLLAY